MSCSSSSSDPLCSVARPDRNTIILKERRRIPCGSASRFRRLLRKPLAIVPIDRLKETESLDPNRASLVADSLAADGVQIDPINITPSWYILDGHNRTAGLAMHGIHHVLARIHEPDTVKCFTWLSLLKSDWRPNGSDWDFASRLVGPEEFIRALEISACGYVDLNGGQSPSCRLFHPGFSLLDNVRIQNRVVEELVLHNEGVPLTREKDSICSKSPVAWMRLFRSRFSGLLVYPSLSVDEVIHIAEAGLRVPPGGTRFIFEDRHQGLRIPLDFLALSNVTIEEKNRRLSNALSSGSERVYEEPIVFYENLSWDLLWKEA